MDRCEACRARDSCLQVCLLCLPPCADAMRLNPKYRFQLPQRHRPAADVPTFAGRCLETRLRRRMPLQQSAT